MGGRRPLAERRRGGARRRTTAQGRGIPLRPSLYLSPVARDPHCADRPRGARPALDSRRALVAPEREALRRASGPQQEGDGAEVRRRAALQVAARLRDHAAAPRRAGRLPPEVRSALCEFAAGDPPGPVSYTHLTLPTN